MTDRTMDVVERENAYLKMRVAQLQANLDDISAENRRLVEERERLHIKRAARPAYPFGDNQ